MAELGEFSRFINTDEVVVDGKETLGVWQPPNFIKARPSDDQIGIFRVTNAVEGRPDLISQQLYGTPKLFWVLIAFNKIRNPLNWPKAGSTIEYPSESVVFPQVSG